MRRRLPVRRRVRLAPLRRLWLRWLWLLLPMGPLQHLLTAHSLNPEHNKSPSQHCETGRGPTVLAVPTERGANTIRPNAERESIAEAGTFHCRTIACLAAAPCLASKLFPGICSTRR
jgi:hypothetical protein